MVCAIEDAGFEIREGVEWLYATGQVRRRDGMKGAHEPICIARRPLAGATVRDNIETWGTGSLFIDAARGEVGRWPTNVVHTGAFDQPWFYHAKASRAERVGSEHPTVKPVNLMRWLVRLISPPGGIVLDPFAGTGTTGAAAILEGRRALMIEREPEYVRDIARRFLRLFVDYPQA